MDLEYTTNSCWVRGYGYYILLGYHDDKETSHYLTVEDIDLLKSIGYNMIFQPCF